MTRRRSSSRRSVRLTAALLVAFVIGTAAAPPVDASRSSSAQPAGAATMTLVDQTTWVRPGEELLLSLDLQGVPAGAVLHVDVHQSLDNRTELDQTMSDEEEPELGSVVGGWESPVDALPQAADGNVQTSAVIGGGGVDLDQFGVYPVRVTVRDAAGNDVASLVTYLLYVTDEVSGLTPLSVAVVVDLGTTTPSLQADGSVSVPSAAVDEMQGRISALTDVRDIPLSIAPVPETIDALADSGDTGMQVLENLEFAIGGREVVARPYVDLDLSALADAGLVTEIPPEAQGGAQVIRNRFTDERTGGPKEPMGNLWLFDGPVGPADADVLRGQSVTRAVVPQSAVAPVEANDGPVPTHPVSLGEGGPVGMVADEALSGRLVGSGGRLDAQRFLAELMTIWGARPADPRGVVVRVPADANVDPRVLSTALDGLDDGGVINPTSLSGVFDTLSASSEGDAPEAVEWSGDGQDPSLAGLTSPLYAAQKTLGGLATMLDDRVLVASLGRSLLVAPGAHTPEDRRLDYVGRVESEANGIRQSITAPERFQITLTARDGSVPLAIDSSYDQEITLLVTLSSSQLDFPDGETFPLVVPPGRTTHDIRVETLTSGAMPLRITLTSPDGSITLAQANYVVRSTAISGVGLVLSVGAGAFLLLWWGSHWRTARRSRRLITPGAADPHTM